MKITVKTLKGDENFTLDNVTEEQTVLELKQNVAAEKSWEVENLKLIHAGKIMQNDKLVKDYKVKDGGFIVCMVSKKKKPAPAQTPAPTPPTQESTPAAAPPPSTPSQPPAQQQAATPNTEQAAAPNANPQFEAAVSQLKDMGFPESQCRQALQAAFGNADRAVEYLMTGIPEGAGVAPPAPDAAQQGGAAPGIQTIGGDLQALRSHPQFNTLRRIVQTNPQALGTVLQELGRNEPALIQAINNNREQFVEMMNEPIEENDQASGTGQDGTAPASAGDMSNLNNLLGGGNGMPNPQQLAQVVQAMQNLPPERRSQLATAMGIPLEQLQAITQMMQSLPPEALAQMLASGGGGAGMQPRNVVTLTQDEAAAVDRLAELGFSKQACVEAYLACDKNEELAANYLFSNPPEEDTQMEE